MATTQDARALRGANVLILEDECILALDLALIVSDEGAKVAGPLHRIEQAMSLSDLSPIDAAILDVDISGDEVFPFADRLRAANVPIVFHTGRGDVARLRSRYPTARILRKPSPAARIVDTLTAAVGRARERARAAAS